MMEDLLTKIPIEITNLLNNINTKLSDFRNEIDFTAKDIKVSYNGSSYDGVVISYKLRGSSFFFNIKYITSLDLIEWNYLPNSTLSTKVKNGSWVNVDGATLKELSRVLELWKDHIIQVKKLENPVDYFKTDKFIEFYADEIIQTFEIGENDDKTPLSSIKQTLAIELINKSRDFLKLEIASLGDEDSEKRSNLNLANEILEKTSKNISRMTIADIKKNISIFLGAIRKWCGETFLKFLKIDKGNSHDISRMLGSFVGGVLGVPKIGD